MTRRQEKLSKEQLIEKQRLVTDLADSLIEALKNSEMFRKGMNNKQIALDVLMGIGLFSAAIIRASDNVVDNGNNIMERFYSEHLLPSAFEMYDELTADRKDDEERLKFS